MTVPSPAPAPSAPSASRIPAVALLLVSSNLLSAALGYLRESLIADMFGATPATDAYFSAFRLPDLLNHLLAGSALAIAFLPRYTKIFVDDHQRADRFLGIVLGTLGVIVVGGTLLLWLGATPIVAVVFSGFAPATQELTAHLTRIVLPAQVFFVLGGVFKVALFARDRFAAAALAPLVYNTCIILGGLLLGPRLGIEGFAWGVLAGGALGAFGVPFIDAIRRIRVRVRFAPGDPDFRAALWVALPLVLGLSLLTVDEWYLNFLGAGLSAGSVSHLIRARLLMRLPVQVIGGAIGAAALPALTRLWAEGRKAELNDVVLTTLRTALGIGVVGAAAMVLFGRPITTLLFERGAFTVADTTAVSGILIILACAVPFWLTQQVTVRAFYARADTWRPMLLGTAIAGCAFPLYWTLRASYDTTGLAWASATSMAVTATATVALARWLHGTPALRTLAGTAVRSLLIAGLAALVGWWCRGLVEPHLAGIASAPLRALVVLAIAGPAYAAASLAGVFTLGDAPMRGAVRKILRRLRFART